MRCLLFLSGLASLVLSGCHARDEDSRIEISVIAGSAGPAILAAATAAETSAGLVRLDREGQVIPGAAARWAILDDGLDYIFRIDDNAGLSAATIARRLRAARRFYAHSPDFAALAPIDSINAVTSTVVEMRLSAPQPDLLPLLARSEFTVRAPGTMRAAETGANQVLLSARSDEDPPLSAHLHIERVGRAVAGFQADKVALVLGGTFSDLPVARAAEVARRDLRFDPATGLFGLAIRNADLASNIRTALSLAIDRDRIIAAVGAPGQAKATTIAGSTIEPPLDQRRATARALMNGDTATVRVAMPPGPGARVLFALLAQDWRAVGIEAVAVASGRPADLALVDQVAPAGTLATLACAVSAGCDPRDRLALINPPFIPLAAPVRWSLVAPSLDQFTENGLAVHPLDQLRTRR